MKTPTSSRRRRESGTAMIEVALTFTAFLLLTVGVMEFAMAVYAYNFCSYASGEAARWASVRGSQYCNSSTPALAALTSTDVSNHVQAEAVALDPSKLSVTATWPTDNNPGSLVQVTVSYTVVPLAGLAISQNLVVSNTSQTVIVH